MLKFLENKQLYFWFICAVLIICLSQTSTAQSGRKKNPNITPTETSVQETVTTEHPQTEPQVHIKSLKIVAQLDHDATYFRSNDFRDALKELERDLSLRYRFSLKVERGDKMDFEEAKELAKTETETFVLWIGFVVKSSSSGVMYFDFAQYAVLMPQTAEFVTKGIIEPRQTEIVNSGGILQIPTTAGKPTLKYGIKESVRRISAILRNGGWFD